MFACEPWWQGAKIEICINKCFAFLSDWKLFLVFSFLLHFVFIENVNNKVQERTIKRVHAVWVCQCWDARRASFLLLLLFHFWNVNCVTRFCFTDFNSFLIQMTFRMLPLAAVYSVCTLSFLLICFSLFSNCTLCTRQPSCLHIWLFVIVFSSSSSASYAILRHCSLPT